MNVLKNSFLEESTLECFEYNSGTAWKELNKDTSESINGTFSELPTNRLAPHLIVAACTCRGAQAVNELFDTSPTKAQSEALGEHRS